ncbi:hypothetical protein NXX42_19395 [Bacteroides thetaiotaomicron]|nr:hypothetical protein [Bacteroides thetaiotaomicron]
MERRLTKSLEDKIASLDISKPYVWQLRLSETDFKELGSLSVGYFVC